MVFGQETLWDGVRRTMRRVRKTRSARASTTVLPDTYGLTPMARPANMGEWIITNQTIGGPLYLTTTATVTIQNCIITSAGATAISTNITTVPYDSNAFQWPWVWSSLNGTAISMNEWDTACDRTAARAERARLCTQQEEAGAAWRHWNGQYWSALEEKALTEEQQRALDRERQERRARAVRAVERAKRLFFSVLTDQQRADFDQLGRFTVQARESGRRYVIRASVADGRHGNIQELGHDGRPVASLCCAPGGNIPHFDAILGQKLALELDEAAFRRTANFTPLVPGYRREAA